MQEHSGQLNTKITIQYDIWIYNHWVDVSAGGYFVLEDIIRPVTKLHDITKIKQDTGSDVAQYKNVRNRRHHRHGVV